MSHLFEPMSLGNVTVKNRLWLGPMSQYSAQATGDHASEPNAWHFQHYASRSVGGYGMVVVESTAVTLEGRATPYCLALDSADKLPAFEQLVDSIRMGGATPAIELNHYGRMASTRQGWMHSSYLAPDAPLGWLPVAPSPIPFTEDGAIPRELTDEDIWGVVRAYREAAERAIRAGFEAVVIAASGGNLLHQFLSPLANHRGDDWGGLFSNRIRLVLEVIDAVREVIGEHPFIVRIAATDWDAAGKGWRLTDAVELVRNGKEHGVDLWDITSGGIVPGVVQEAGPGYHVPLSDRIRRDTHAATSVGGKIISAGQAEQALLSGQADAVVAGRNALRDPYLARRWQSELDGVDSWPLQYWRGI
ncbi:oxidoreductase [Ancrocorticia sp.]|uniref:oxidoreductase n=1 Tax=Ancrocorticia sp. TaxID=2593684 RepID=UPI003F914034